MTAAAIRTALSFVLLTVALSVSACSPSLPLLPESAPLPPLPQPSPPTPPAEPPAAAEIAPAFGPDWLDRERLALDLDLGVEDWRHFYGWPNVAGVPLGVGAAAPVANTSADRDIQRWYRTRIKNGAPDSLAEFANVAGQLWVALPIGMEAAAVLGWVEGGSPTDGGIWEWSSRSLRAAAVGYPPVIAGYFLLGAERPDGDSRWRPFNDWHGVSGHTFIGAVPFLTAAAMTDDPFVKAPLVLGSFLTGWSRIHKDEHYFSQVALGWWMAYLAVWAVDQTQDERKALTVTPSVTPQGPGLSVLYQF